MRVITPLFVATNASVASAQPYLTSSTVAEPDLTRTPPEATWVAATSYTVGQQVIRATTHMVYENILAGVNATLPETDAALATPTRWVRKGATNRYAMLDTIRNSKTTTASPLTVVLTPGVRIDAIGLAGMSADSVTISMTSNAATVYTVTKNLSTREILNWYDYFFDPFTTQPSLAYFNLPPYTNGIITITLTATSGTVSLGAIVIGSQTYVGQIQYNAVSDEQNFSRIDRLFDGTASLLQRRSIPKIKANVWSEKNNTNKIRALRTKLNAVPAFWSGLDDLSTDGYFEALLIVGIYKQFEIDLTSPAHTIVNIEIEEI